jgi:hypothetical protein
MAKEAACWDIETEDWTTFVCGAIHERGPRGKRETTVYDWRHEEDYVKHLLSIEGPLYSFNGGRFDMKWLLDAMHKFGVLEPRRVMAKPSAIISIRCGKAQFLDACLTFPMKLKEFTNGEKGNLRSLCQCGQDCGGFCAIRRDASSATLGTIKDYNALDCESLWDGIEHFQTVASGLDIDLCSTIGSSAWRTVKRRLSLPNSPYIVGKGKRFALWGLVRAAYYGGRDEIYKTESAHGYQYDVNSMYPAAIAKTPLPVGSMSLWTGVEAMAAWHRREPGVYYASVQVPRMQIPPLPCRVGWRTAYPTGKFSGCWTEPELRYAESVGVTVTSIQTAITWEEERILFTGWVNEMYAARMKFGKASREGKWLKLVMNSLTGKFGTNCDSQVIHIDPHEVEPCTCGSDECECGGMTPFGGTDWMFQSQKKILYQCSRPEWAAYLTAVSRVELHKQLLAGRDNWGQSDAVYCATDSCFSEKIRERNIGAGLGEWLDEGPYEAFEAMAPKVYHYWKPGDAGPKEKVRCKGIPTRDWGKIARGERIDFESMTGARSPVNGKFFVRVKNHRRVTRNTGSRVLIGDGPETRPMSYDEALGFFGTEKEREANAVSHSDGV